MAISFSGFVGKGSGRVDRVMNAWSLMSYVRGRLYSRHLLGTPSPKSIGTSGHWKVEAAGCTISRTIPAHFLDLLDTGRPGGGGGVYGTGSYWVF